MLLDQRRPLEAATYLRQALTIKERNAKPTDPGLAALRMQLAEVYLACGYWPHAGALLEQQIASGVQVRPAKLLLAEAFVLDGKTLEAETLIAALISDAEVRKGEWNIELCEPLLLRAHIQAEAGECGAAVESLERVLACAERVGNTEMAQRARAGLGQLYRLAGRPADAAATLSSYIGIATGVMHQSAMSTIPFMRDQGAALTELGNAGDGARITRRADLVLQAAQRDGETAERIAAATSDYGNWWRKSRPESTPAPPA